MRKLLLPISFIYHIVLSIRHKLFDWHLLKSHSFDLPIICIGNLSLGGTGKTPLTEHLISTLSPDYHVATLSRGYGRKTKGFLLADGSITSDDIGDEPMQYFTKFKNVQVAVDENRVEGVQNLMESPTPPSVILLDDAFQHRRIRAGLNILVTDYHKLYSEDFLIPAGTLRDIRSAAQRAEIIVVSKSPKEASEKEKQAIIKRLKTSGRQKVFFSYLEHQPLKALNAQSKVIDANQAESVLLFSGIANPKPLVDYLKSKYPHVETMIFNDHHPYSENDIKRIVQRFEEMGNMQKIMVTTEKDAARLANSAYLCQLELAPLFVAPIRLCFFEEEKFNEEIKNYVRENTRDRGVSAQNDQRI